MARLLIHVEAKRKRPLSTSSWLTICTTLATKSSVRS